MAFECSGGRSLRDHQRRLRRDASVVASGAVDALYRLRGSDLLDHMDDTLYLVDQWETSAPDTVDLFSERGRINLHTLATREAKNIRLRPEQAAALVTYEIDPEQEEYFSERHLWHAANGTNPFILPPPVRPALRRSVDAARGRHRAHAAATASHRLVRRPL